MQNPFKLGVFPHICRVLAPYAPRDEENPERAVLRLVVDEARRRLFEGLYVEAYDWDDVVASVAARLVGGGEAPRLDIAALVRYYGKQPGMIWSLPGAHEVLSTLKKRGYTLVVVSNGYHKYQLPVLEALGLDGFFSGFVTPERVGDAKPRSAIFRAAWQGDDAPLHVGDDLIHDAWGARAAGGYSVWLHRNAPEEIRSALPEERPRADEFAAVRDAAYASTWAVEAYGVSAEECVPHALIWDLGELPELVSRVRPLA